MFDLQSLAHAGVGGMANRRARTSCYSGGAVRCLEENTLFEYVHDGLDDAVRAAIGDHASTCDACRQLIAAAVRAMPASWRTWRAGA